MNLTFNGGFLDPDSENSYIVIDLFFIMKKFSPFADHLMSTINPVFSLCIILSNTNSGWSLDINRTYPLNTSSSSSPTCLLLPSFGQKFLLVVQPSSFDYLSPLALPKNFSFLDQQNATKGSFLFLPRFSVPELNEKNLERAVVNSCSHYTSIWVQHDRLNFGIWRQVLQEHILDEHPSFANNTMISWW